MAGLDDEHTCSSWYLPHSKTRGECHGSPPPVTPVTRRVEGWSAEAVWPELPSDDPGCAHHSARYARPASAEDLNLLTAADLNFVAEAVAGHLADIANVTVTDPDPVDLGKREG